MLEILDLPVKDKEIFIFPETKETSKSVTSVGVEIIAIPRCSSDYDEVLTHIGVVQLSDRPLLCIKLVGLASYQTDVLKGPGSATCDMT